MITKEQKKELIKKFGSSEKDTGSTSVQVAILSARINQLTQHFKTHKHDNQSRRGLLKLVGSRRNLLKYLKGTSPQTHKETLSSLNLRK
ncbi:MAG: 30S ribosomal protein S15 [SAR324 cluster bacterium]|nr:30S ribosomal protein S15 [SAR324 cluster bacterium]